MRLLVGATLLFWTLVATPADIPPADELSEAVTRMARVGRCGSPTFSPDGATLAFVCDMSGIP
jgi:hypothetical protein